MSRYKQNIRKLEKYIGHPIMRTFCTPPKDGTGLLVSTVFVAAAAVSLGCNSSSSSSNYMQQTLLVAVLCASIMGQLVPGLAWLATGISKENADNKHRAAIIRSRRKEHLENKARTIREEQGAGNT